LAGMNPELRDFKRVFLGEFLVKNWRG